MEAAARWFMCYILFSADECFWQTCGEPVALKAHLYERWLSSLSRLCRWGADHLGFHGWQEALDSRHKCRI